MNDKIRALLASEAVRFVLSGGFNTFVTWLLYLALNVVLSYEVSYSLSYAAGILLAYVIGTRWVFDTKMSLRTFLQFPLVYVVQYALGLALMYALVEIVRVPESVAPLVVTVLTIPVTFLLSRFILKKPDMPSDRGA